MATTWYYSLYGIISWENPEVIEIWRYVKRVSTEVPTDDDFIFLFYKDPLWTDMQVEIIEVNYTVDYFYKHTRISFLDTVTNERVYFDDYCSIPPFNHTPPSGDLLHSQTHQVPPPPPPPPVQPPPTVTPPTPVTPQPPVTPPVTFEPPPLNPPPPPILPDQPPRRPPIGRLYPSGDFAVWNEFVKRWGDRVGRWALEVPISRGLELSGELEDWQRKMVQSITTHKIDFIIEWGRVFYMGEIKPRGSISALGSALIQWQMANKMYRFDKLTRPAVICATISPILLPIAAQNGIVVFVTHGLDTELGARVIEI